MAASSPIDAYLAEVDEPARSTLASLRRTILGLLPEAEEVISYGVCAFRVRGTAIAGFGAFRRHCSYFPFSGSVIAALGERLTGHAGTKSSLHFPLDRPLEEDVVAMLVAERLHEAFGDAP